MSCVSLFPAHFTHLLLFFSYFIPSNELNCNISGEPIVLLTDEEIELNQEWEDFSAHII